MQKRNASTKAQIKAIIADYQWQKSEEMLMVHKVFTADALYWEKR